MTIQVEVRNAATDLVIGEGPVYTVTDYAHTWRLDAAGKWSFSAPATDERTNLLQLGRLHLAYGEVLGERTHLAQGIIEQVSVDAARLMLTVQGDDRLRELANRHIKELEIVGESTSVTPAKVALVTPGGGYTELANAYDGNAGTWNAVTFAGGGAEFLYIGSPHPFRRVDFDLSQFNASGNAANTQYFNGQWISLTVTDTTQVLPNDYSFAQDGYMAWSYPADWRPLPTNGNNLYWIRIWPPAAYNEIRINGIVITGRVPIDTGPQLIMTQAPSGWTLAAGWYNTTAEPVYLKLNDVSVLEALRRLAEATGEHFRISDTNWKEIEWLGTDKPVAEIVALAAPGGPASESNPGVAHITSLTRRDDQYEKVTRVYPYGAGSGNARVTLEGATGSVPAGYTYNASLNYVERTLTGDETLIERRQDFSDIRPEADTDAASVAASNQLLHAAVAWLQERDRAQFYDVTLAKVDAPLRPGEMLRVIWKEIVGSYVALDIDEMLRVLEVTRDMDSDGLRTVKVLVATVDRYPVTNAGIIADQVEQQSRRSRQDILLSERDVERALTPGVMYRATETLAASS